MSLFFSGLGSLITILFQVQVCPDPSCQWRGEGLPQLIGHISGSHSSSPDNFITPANQRNSNTGSENQQLNPGLNNQLRRYKSSKDEEQPLENDKMKIELDGLDNINFYNMNFEPKCFSIISDCLTMSGSDSSIPSPVSSSGVSAQLTKPNLEHSFPQPNHPGGFGPVRYYQLTSLPPTFGIKQM